MRSHNQKRQARSNLLVTRARTMLHAPTASEAALWEALRGNALGVAFKRQVPLGDRYIADFFAPCGSSWKWMAACIAGVARRIAGGMSGCSVEGIVWCASRLWRC